MLCRQIGVWSFVVFGFWASPVQAQDEDEELPCEYECESEGRCTPKEGDCVATDDADCESSMECYDEGTCALGEAGRCVLSAEGCEGSAPCQYEGLCGYRDGACVLSAEGCSGAQVCEQDGECTLNSDGDSCVVGSSDDCEQSLLCATDGSCHFDAGQCVANEEGCRSSEACVNQGLCALIDERCQAGSVADCAKSLFCAEQGQCGFEDGQGGCVVQSADHCADSEICAERGLCGFKEATCVAESDEQCQASSKCAAHGHCSVVDGACFPENQADCEGSTDCANEKACFFFDGEDDFRGEAYCGLEDGAHVGSLAMLLGRSDGASLFDSGAGFDGLGGSDVALGTWDEASGGMGFGMGGGGGGFGMGGGGGGGGSGVYIESGEEGDVDDYGEFEGGFGYHEPQGARDESELEIETAPSASIQVEGHTCPEGLTVHREETLDGALRRWCEDAAGLKQGSEVTHHSTGASSSAVYHEGALHGPFEFAKEGRLLMRGQYEDGLRTGRWERWASDGAPRAVGYFESNVEVGLWRIFDAEGEDSHLCDAIIDDDCRF